MSCETTKYKGLFEGPLILQHGLVSLSFCLSGLGKNMLSTRWREFKERTQSQREFCDQNTSLV